MEHGNLAQGDNAKANDEIMNAQKLLVKMEALKELEEAKRTWSGMEKSYDARIIKLKEWQKSTAQALNLVDEKYNLILKEITEASDKSAKDEGLTKLPIFDEETKEQLSILMTPPKDTLD
jgi:hypothetical protein